MSDKKSCSQRGTHCRSGQEVVHHKFNIRFSLLLDPDLWPFASRSHGSPRLGSHSCAFCIPCVTSTPCQTWGSPLSTPVVLIKQHSVLQEKCCNRERLLSMNFPLEMRVRIKEDFKNNSELFIALSLTANGAFIFVKYQVTVENNRR